MGSIFSQSVGRKLFMSLAGIFLLTFLVVHLGINLLVLLKTTKPFNIAANFMSTNIVIKVFEIVLFGGFFIHMIFGMVFSLQNMMARPEKYKKSNHSQTSFFSKYMFHTALLITAFLVIHLIDFFFKSRFSHEVKEITYDGGLTHLEDMGSLVIEKFSMLGFVIAYVVAFIFLGFHLLHGFQSAFQTLGFNHKIYSPVIKLFGVLYTIFIVAGYSAIPVVIYFFK